MALGVEVTKLYAYSRKNKLDNIKKVWNNMLRLSNNRENKMKKIIRQWVLLHDINAETDEVVVVVDNYPEGLVALVERKIPVTENLEVI